MIRDNLIKKAEMDKRLTRMESSVMGFNEFLMRRSPEPEKLYTVHFVPVQG